MSNRLAKSDTVSVSPMLRLQTDDFARRIGHVLLMRVDPEAARALNLTRFTAAGGTSHALGIARSDLARTAGSADNGDR